jgi:small-conductance mechanosensitive channel
MSEADRVIAQLNDFFKLISAPFMHLSGSEVSVLSIFISLAIVVISIKLGRTLGRLSNRYLSTKAVDSGVRDSIEKFVRYILIGSGILFALDNLGISLSSLAAVGAILMVGIGFGLQNIAQNFISGIILLIERPIKVGDIVRVGLTSGRVVDIRVRSTVILTRDDVAIIVPNSKLVSEEVVNDSYTGQNIRQHIKVGVAYGSNLDLVKELLCQAAKTHSKVDSQLEPAAIFKNFGDSSLDFDLRFLINDIWNAELIMSEIRFEIDRLFREAKIEIPFPQRVVQIKADRL